MKGIFDFRFSIFDLLIPVIILMLSTLSGAQMIKLDDGSVIKIENPKGLALSEDDKQQIINAMKDIKGYRTTDQEGRDARDTMAIQNYERQIKTELGIEKARRETLREYDRLDRDLSKTRRLKEGRDIIIYNERPFGSSGRR